MSNLENYRPVVSALILDGDNNVLLAHNKSHSPDFWKFPQGGVETGESLEEAVLREMKEELSSSSFTILKKSDIKYKYKWPAEIQKNKGHVGSSVTFFILRCEDISSIKPNLEIEELDSIKWVELDELYSCFPTLPDFADTIKKLTSEAKNLIECSESSASKQVAINVIKGEENNITDILRLYPKASEKQIEEIKHNVSKDIKDFKKGNRLIYSTKLNNEVIGTAQLIFDMDKDYYANGNSKAHMSHVRILEKFRGKGIGSQMVEKIENEARTRNFKEMTLGVEETNEKAIKFYEILGYKKFMQETGDKGEIIICMKKKL